MSRAAGRLCASMRTAGCTFTLLQDGQPHSLMGCIQPKAVREFNPGPLGWEDPTEYLLYIAWQGSIPVPCPGNSIICKNEQYRVETSHLHSLGGAPMYYRCVLRRQVEEGDSF